MRELRFKANLMKSKALLATPHCLWGDVQSIALVHRHLMGAKKASYKLIYVSLVFRHFEWAAYFFNHITEAVSWEVSTPADWGIIHPTGLSMNTGDSVESLACGLVPGQSSWSQLSWHYLRFMAFLASVIPLKVAALSTFLGHSG